MTQNLKGKEKENKKGLENESEPDDDAGLPADLLDDENIFEGKPVEELELDEEKFNLLYNTIIPAIDGVEFSLDDPYIDDIIDDQIQKVALKENDEGLASYKRDKGFFLDGIKSALVQIEDEEDKILAKSEYTPEDEKQEQLFVEFSERVLQNTRKDLKIALNLFFNNFSALQVSIEDVLKRVDVLEEDVDENQKNIFRLRLGSWRYHIFRPFRWLWKHIKKRRVTKVKSDLVALDEKITEVKDKLAKKMSGMDSQITVLMNTASEQIKDKDVVEVKPSIQKKKKSKKVVKKVG